MDPLTAIGAFVIGLAAGSLSTLFGIGGAILLIPAFRMLLALDGHEAIATALPVTIPTAMLGAAQYHLKALVRIKTAITCGIVGSLASIAGALATGLFSGEQLMLMEGGLFLALSYVAATSDGARAKTKPMPLSAKAGYSILIGAVGGVLSGFFGIGAGAVLVPMLMRLRKLSMSQAVATSLAIVSIYSIPGALTHLAIGNIVLEAMLPAVAGALIGVVGASGMVESMDEEKRKRAFGAFLAALGIAMIAYEALIILGFL